MTTLAIIGGTGLARMKGLDITRREMVKTPYGAPSCPLLFGTLHGKPVVFLARHGSKQRIPAHTVNYCANIWALHSVGVRSVLAVGVVGGIEDDCVPGCVVIPDQIIDYTQNRVNTYVDGGQDSIKHIDFSYPYDHTLRQALINGAEAAGIPMIDHGTYAAAEGPRLETVAEVKRMERDGCSIVGLSGMPEAALARELDIAYATCAVVVNPAAGKGDGAINVSELSQSIEKGMEQAQAVIYKTLELL